MLGCVEPRSRAQSCMLAHMALFSRVQVHRGKKGRKKAKKKKKQKAEDEADHV